MFFFVYNIMNMFFLKINEIFIIFLYVNGVLEIGLRFFGGFCDAHFVCLVKNINIFLRLQIIEWARNNNVILFFDFGKMVDADYRVNIHINVSG